MINPETLDLSTLPSLLLSDRKQLPSVSCIYFAMSSGNVQYIGRSVNLQQRWIDHHQVKHLNKETNIAWLEISDSVLLPEIESALIQWFKPPLNKEISGTSIRTKSINPLIVVPPRPKVSSYVSVPSVWRLRQIMADKKIANQELADKINAITGKKIHVVTISRWKRFDVMPKINGAELDAIVSSLGVSRNDLLGEK